MDISEYISEETYYLLWGVIIGVGFLFILRDFWCWFWKINEVSKLLKEIRDLLSGQTTNIVTNPKTPIMKKSKFVNGNLILCPGCDVRQSAKRDICKECGTPLKK